MILYIISCILWFVIGYMLANRRRKVRAIEKHINNDKWYWCRGILPHRELYTQEASKYARATSARIRREYWRNGWRAKLRKFFCKPTPEK